jgi:hypothetical protein
VLLSRIPPRSDRLILKARSAGPSWDEIGERFAMSELRVECGRVEGHEKRKRRCNRAKAKRRQSRDW